MCREQQTKLEVEQLVAVHRVDGPLAFPRLRCQPQPSSAAQWLGLADRDELEPEAAELALEQLLLPRGAADDHAVDAGFGQQCDLVRRQRPPGDRDERLRPSFRSVGEPLGLAAGEDDRLQR